jgi:hypothetical protein
MKDKADTPEKKERHQDGVIRASRAMNQSIYMTSMRGFVSFNLICGAFLPDNLPTIGLRRTPRWFLRKISLS